MITVEADNDNQELAALIATPHIKGEDLYTIYNSDTQNWRYAVKRPLPEPFTPLNEAILAKFTPEQRWRLEAYQIQSFDLTRTFFYAVYYSDQSPIDLHLKGVNLRGIFKTDEPIRAQENSMSGRRLDERRLTVDYPNLPQIASYIPKRTVWISGFPLYSQDDSEKIVLDRNRIQVDIEFRDSREILEKDIAQREAEPELALTKVLRLEEELQAARARLVLVQSPMYRIKLQELKANLADLNSKPNPFIAQ